MTFEGVLVSGLGTIKKIKTKQSKTKQNETKQNKRTRMQAAALYIEARQIKQSIAVVQNEKKTETVSCLMKLLSVCLLWLLKEGPVYFHEQ